MNVKFVLSILFILIFNHNISVFAQGFETGSIKIISTTEEILGKEAALQYADIIDIDEEVTWWTYVPKTYDPTKPIGILLYQIYGDQFREPRGWKTVMDEKNMIFIKLHYEGKILTPKKELLLSVLAPLALQKKYQINGRRIYTSSKNFCRSAGNIAKIYPNIFKGALYINCHPVTWNDEVPATIDQMRQNRYLFISGQYRSEYVDNKQELSKYHDAGIVNAKYVRTARIRKFDNLTRPILSDAIDYLDGNDNVALLKKTK